jgi:hypothetical protein
VNLRLDPSLFPPRSRSLLARALLQPSSPRPLAALRVVTASSIALLSVHLDPLAHSRLPTVFEDPSWGLGTLIVQFAQEAALVQALWIALLVACAAMAVGWHSRASAGITAGLAVFVLGVPMQYGAVSARHHLVWFAVILAFSPCGDVWSVDARGRPSPVASVRYGFPLRCVWLLFGLMYLFPGLAKLRAGPSWVGAFHWQIAARQWESGTDAWFLPMSRPLAAVAATALIAFELTFAVLVFTRWRPVVVVTGLVFHLLSGLVCGIWFWHFVVGYVAFLGSRPKVHDDRRPARAPTAACLIVVGSVFLAGLTFDMDGWPVASYPQFGDVMDHRLWQVGVVDRNDDHEIALASRLEWADPRRLNSMIRSVVDRDPEKAADAFAEIAGRPVDVMMLVRDLGADGAVIDRTRLARSGAP